MDLSEMTAFLKYFTAFIGAATALKGFMKNLYEEKPTVCSSKRSAGSGGRSTRRRHS